MGQDTTRRPAQRTLKNIVLTGGAQPDASQDMVPVVDSNNVVPRPDGTGMVSREGTAIFQKYEVATDPPGRIALVVDTAPPNQSDGSWLLCAVDTSSGNAIRAIHQFRPRTNLAGDTVISVVGFERSQYAAIYGGTVGVTITRSGAVDRTAVVHVTSIDGNGYGAPHDAEAGTDFTAVDEDVAFAAGQVEATLTLTTAASVDNFPKYFRLAITSETQGCSVDGARGQTLVQIGSAYGVIAVGDSVSEYDIGGNPQFAGRLWISNPNAGEGANAFAAYVRDIGPIAGSVTASDYRCSGAALAPDIVGVVATVNNAGWGRAKIVFLRVSTYVGEGPAYAGGATDIAGAVITHGRAPAGDLEIYDFPISYKNFGGISVSAMYAWLVPYQPLSNAFTGSSARCLLFGSDNIWHIDFTTPEHPTIEKTVAVEKVTPGGAVLNEPIPLWNGVYGIVLADNTIICQRTATSGANLIPMFVRYNPETGKIINWRTNPMSLTPAGTYASRPMCAMRDGGFVVFDTVNDRAWYSTSDMATFNDLGPVDLATSPSWRACSYQSNKVLYLANVAGNAVWKIATVTQASFTTDATVIFDDGSVQVQKPSSVAVIPSGSYAMNAAWDNAQGLYLVASDDITGSNHADFLRSDADGAETIDTGFADDPPLPDPWMNELLYVRGAF